jgi:hypothetical protein
MFFSFDAELYVRAQPFAISATSVSAIGTGETKPVWEVRHTSRSQSETDVRNLYMSRSITKVEVTGFEPLTPLTPSTEDGLNGSL